jgi:long-chain acyl-CoA synthetase
MNRAILITGAAGFLGTQVTRLILEQTNQPIIVLVRGQDLAAARLRLERSWWDWPELVKAIGGRIQVLTGDLSRPQLGLNDADYLNLTVTVSHIIHLAADLRLNEPLDVLRQTNVKGVQNILELAYTIQRLHGLVRFSHVSTAYVAGRRTGEVPEEALTRQYGFANNYELTKFEAESLVQAAKADLPISVFRPGMVVGDSKSGAIKTFNTLYFPLRLYLTGKIKIFPVNSNMKINLVPGDYVAEAIVKLTFDPRAVGLNFHLTLPVGSLPTVSELIQSTRKWALEKLRLQLPTPVFLPVSVCRFKWLRYFLSSKSPLRSLLALAPYFEENRIYQRDNLDRLLGAYLADWRSFLPQILEYAVYKGFMHRSERTVHEQALFRLASKSRPVKYYDLISGKAIPRSAEEIRHEIEMVASSLAQLGIKPGDRVAMVGFNSTRYLVIDIAVGLSGGMSVPLYYSSPVRELLDIINDSGARIFFVGVPEILEQLATTDIHINIPVISFCRQTPRCYLPDNFIDWQRFLNLGAGFTAPLAAPVNFNAPATLRYTSGTTGCPKGALFTHAQLRFMAETLASLPPWQARTRKIFYLSFLPMNHVVEGILAGYALYYAPAPFDIYYLEDFHELQKVVSKVRPTVFFSVPRFYEKVWEKAAQSFIGSRYLKSKAGFRKRLLRILLRQAVCQAAGIDRCSQLIVGSAPVNAGLLQAFRELEIEIHNAYGLTEAPLITLNRFQANNIETVGQPLPDTQIRIARDGEVLVKGPQVMQEYFKNASESPLADGWLHTEDLGALTAGNYLVLHGRKKEVIIDSYGKNINPAKVELLLSEITGISQIMVCGNNKPYCTALFWIARTQAPVSIAAIEAGVIKANQQLSRPEQVKRWAVLTDTLSIDDGELTANLKMKRAAISLKYAEIIEDLYKQDKAIPRTGVGVSFGQID